MPCRQAAAAHRRTSDRRRTLALAPQPYPCSPQHACVCLATQQPHVNPHACRCLSAAAQCWYVCESESAEQGPERQKKIIISLFFRYFGCKPSMRAGNSVQFLLLRCIQALQLFFVGRYCMRGLPIISTCTVRGCLYTCHRARYVSDSISRTNGELPCLCPLCLPHTHLFAFLASPPLAP